MRTCIGCRQQAPIVRLTRVIRRSDGTLEVGRSLPGRGAWLCTGLLACVEQAARRDAFRRALRGPIELGAVAEVKEALHPGHGAGDQGPRNDEERARMDQYADQVGATRR